MKVGQSERDPESRIAEWSNEKHGEVRIECAVLVTDAATHKEMVWQKLAKIDATESQGNQGSNLLSFEQLSVIIALFAFVASKPAALAQGGVS